MTGTIYENVQLIPRNMHYFTYASQGYFTGNVGHDANAPVPMEAIRKNVGKRILGIQ